MPSTNWSPILLPSSSVAQLAWDAVHAISEAVYTQDYRKPADSPAGQAPHEASLLYGYLACACRGTNWRDRAIARLNEAINSAASLTNSALFGGLCGLGWTIEHLSRLLTEGVDFEDAAGFDSVEQEEEDTDPNADIDALLIRGLERGRWHGPQDLISGLVGFGVYLLERVPSEKAVLGTQLVLYHLEKNAVPTGQGLVWHVPVEALSAPDAQLYPDGYYDLGVAHGVPGVIHFLSEASAAGIDRERADRLLEGAMDWLMAQRNPAGSLARFRKRVAPGESPDSPLAWCYGDLGIMAVLQQVARRAGREDWQKAADDLLDHCLARPADQSGVIDAPFCHGAAGIAHIFNRIYQEGGDPQCHAAALSWFERTLSMRQPGCKDGGFVTASDAPVPNVHPALLDGLIGVALALLAAVTPVEPIWDRMLLLSGREWPIRA